jgi:hypothetical protein
MKKTIGLLLIFVCLCPSAFSQTAEACRAAVQHLSLPSTIEFAELHPGQPLTPIKFLFSLQGKDIYLATALAPPYPWILMTDQPLTLLVVYQDERERQKATELLHEMGSGGMLMRASSPPLDNLKFSAVHCANTWSKFLSTGSCKVHDLIYYEPQACEVVPTANSPAEMSTLAMLSPRNRLDVMNNFNWLNGIVVTSEIRVPEIKFPMEKVKEIGKK